MTDATSHVRPVPTPAPVRHRRPGRHRVLGQFLASQGVGQAADALTAIVLAQLLISTDDSGLEPRALLHTLGAVAVPYAIVGPLSGVVADRWSRRRLLGGVHLARVFATFVAIAALQLEHRPLGLFAAAVLLSFARLVYNLRAAALPIVAPDDRLVDADSRSLLVGMIALTLGVSLGSIGATTATTTMLSLAAGGQLLAAIGFITLPLSLGGRTAGARSPTVGIARRLGGLIMSRPTRFAIVLTSLHRGLLGALFVTFVLMAASEFGMGPHAYVFAVAVSGLGTFAGTLTAPAASRVLGTPRLAVAAFALPGVGLIAVASGGWPPITAVAITMSFFAFQNLRVTTDATVQAHIADDARARVFSVYDAAYNLSYFAGATLAITLHVATAPMPAYLAIGLADLTIAAALFARRARLTAPSGPIPPAPTRSVSTRSVSKGTHAVTTQA